jgi:hypothetical protein
MADQSLTHAGSESLPRVGDDGDPDWDRVLNDVEALANEVRGFNSSDYDTAEVGDVKIDMPGHTESAPAPGDLDLADLLDDPPRESGGSAITAPITSALARQLEASALPEALADAHEQDDSEHAPDTRTVDPNEIRRVAEYAAMEAQFEIGAELEAMKGPEENTATPRHYPGDEDPALGPLATPESRPASEPEVPGFKRSNLEETADQDPPGPPRRKRSRRKRG